MSDTATQTLSVSHGEDANFVAKPLYDYFGSATQSHGDNTWLSQGGIELSYANAASIINDISEGLAGLGLKKGDRVGLCMPNAIAYPLFSFACWRQGLVVVGMTALYAEPMLRTLIEESTPKLVVTMAAGDLPERVTKAAEGLCETLILSPDGQDLLSAGQSGFAAPSGSKSYADMLSARAASPQATIAVSEDLALLQFTGGTTGKPKGTMLTHGNVSSCLEQLLHYMPEFQRGAEKFIASGPFSHILGTSLIMGACTSLASEMAIPDRFHPEETTQFIIDKGITMIAGVPTMFQAIARSKAAAASDWPDLRYGFCGGAPLPPEIADEFFQVTGNKIVQGYGLSETSSGVSFTPPSMNCPDYSVGFPLPNSRVEIRDPSDGKTILPRGEVGEVCMTGPQLMQGYWNRQDATDEAMRHGVFHTGDTGYLDPDGALFIVDRIKDIIIASGFNVYPSQVESAVYEHPGIAEVAIIGAKDEYRGETVKAVIALKPGEALEIDDLQSFLKDKLSPIEIPKLLEIRGALPKTPVGKIDKTQLR